MANRRRAPRGSTLSLFLRAIGKVLGWRLGGKTWPHPFFARDTRAPIYPLTVISQERREALRALLRPASDGAGRVLMKPQRPAFSFSAACGAKYVSTPSAPARLKPTRLSIIARSPSIQPFCAAPAIIAYSPETW